LGRKAQKRNLEALKMLIVKNSKSDLFFRKIYANKPLWLLIQILGAFSAAYLLQNPYRMILLEIAAITGKTLSIQTLSSFIGIFLLVIQGFLYITLVLFFFNSLKNSIFKHQFLIFPVIWSLVPHSWNLSSSAFVFPTQNLIFNFMVYALPCIVGFMNIHKIASEKLVET
jgi:hypothetical protein